jgi:tetratricopeptide (TPR) repeat protein
VDSHFGQRLLASLGGAALSAGARVAGIAAAALIAGGLAFLTFQRNEDYRDELRLWESALAVRPLNPRASAAIGLIMESRGQDREAIRCYQQAVGLKMQYADARVALGRVLARQGMYAEAMRHFRTVLHNIPDHPVAMDHLAWVLATCDQERFRNGLEAVELAERACRLAGEKYPMFHDTLAAAYAEAGRFDKALAAIDRACQMGESVLPEDTFRSMQQRRQLYLAGRPYRQAPASRPAH